MQDKPIDDRMSQELLGHYKPVALRAVAAAYSIRPSRTETAVHGRTQDGASGGLDMMEWDEPEMSFIR